MLESSEFVSSEFVHQIHGRPRSETNVKSAKDWGIQAVGSSVASTSHACIVYYRNIVLSRYRFVMMRGVTMLLRHLRELRDGLSKHVGQYGN